MAIKIYVENLPADISEDRLKDIFTQIGEVQSVRVKPDLLTLLTDHPTGSGIVEMTLDVDSYRAVHCFEGATFKDRKIHLEEVKPLLDKAKDMFDHLAEGHTLPTFNPMAALDRWKAQHKNH
jgi:RNA recognition motif-containing protein